jgi:His/Glu/Gln/Arg/opine family amino acid ABC transporter permease subunit
MGNIFDFPFFLSTFPELAKVVPVTLKITLVAMLASLAAGLAVALVRIYRVPGLAQLAALYVSFARGTPMLVQIYLSYYGLPLAMAFLKTKYGWSLDLSQVPAIVFIYLIIGQPQLERALSKSIFNRTQ